MRKIWKWIKRSIFLCGLVFIAIIGFVFLTLLFSQNKQSAEIKNGTVLHVDLSKNYPETYSNDALVRLMYAGPQTSKLDVIQKITAAATDPRVRAMYLSLPTSSISLSDVQEYSTALDSFRTSGKDIIGFAQTFGEFSAGNTAYLLGVSCTQLYIQPSGDVGLTGLRIETPFAARTLEKIGVTPQIHKRKEYKTAPNLFTETGFTKEQRNSLAALLDDLHLQLIERIVQRRDISIDSLLSLIDQGPFLGDKAAESGLIDDVLYQDQVEARLDSLFGEKPGRVSVHAYRPPGSSIGAHKIALVYAVGQIRRGKSEYDPTSAGASYIGSSSLNATLKKVYEDKKVKALVLRVVSPGGSYVASDEIHRVTTTALRDSIPLVVSMGSVAASGGYFISMAADAIVAEPATLTGSIGVYAGKLATRQMWNKLGVTWDGLHRGQNAPIWSFLDPYSPRQDEKISNFVDRAYTDFVQKAATGRGISYDEIEPYAQGRVWTGRQAYSFGLIDTLGGLQTAIELAARKAGVADDFSVTIYPAKKGFVELLRDRDFSLSQAQEGLSALKRVLFYFSETRGIQAKSPDLSID